MSFINKATRKRPTQNRRNYMTREEFEKSYPNVEEGYVTPEEFHQDIKLPDPPYSNLFKKDETT